MLSRLKTWWQLYSGEDETPLDGDVPAWIISILLHMLLIVGVGLLTVQAPHEVTSLTLSTTLDEPLEEPLDPNEFEFTDIPTEEIGTDSIADDAAALSLAPEVADFAEVTSPEQPVAELAPIEFDPSPQMATGLSLNENISVKGAAGVGITGAAGAIDRLTQEILLSLEERPTLVVWLFDQSASLIRQRAEIHDRFARIYEELGHVASAAVPAESGPVLLSSIVAFGRYVTEITKHPTDDVTKLQTALENIERDDSGIENVFTAIQQSAERYRRLRKRGTRNVMLIVFTDEVGEDQHLLESCVQLCRHSAIPVYVVGVPSPFGRKEAIVKWVDPDPAYDQSPQHGRVDQGPESLYPERIKLRFPGQGNVDPILDSGFGPFALTRLCYESGGIYFAVHPNRRVGRDIRGHATQPYASYIRRFFDPETMRQYRPDYVSRDAYVGNVRQLRSRMALVQAAKDSWATSLSTPRTRFVKRNEASLVQQLTRAQKAAAILEPQLDRLYEVLKAGESDREKENVPRWQAGYDLALGRALAAKVRTSGYNMMLAKAKQGMKFQDDQQNTWIMRPAGELDLGSQMNNYATQATEYLERVVAEHPGTPWAYLAERELDHPIGWKWTESYTELEPERDQNTGGGNNNRLPRDDQRRMLERPKPKRPLPKL